MNLARTPIAETLSLAGKDLASTPGSHLIILLTDGEETCGGDPAAVIQSLRGSGRQVQVNIIGFAIDELMLRETFQQWARLGGGQYIDVHNAEQLAAGLASAMERAYEVLDMSGATVASGQINGLAVDLAPGEYRVQPAGGAALAVTVPPGDEVVLTLP
jgi:hypothetical protein